MINKLNNILSQNVGEMECIIKEFVKEAVELEVKGKLTINSIEKLAGKTIAVMIRLILSMAGSLLSNIAIDKGEVYCECGKKMVSAKRNAFTKILSTFGYIPVARDTVFCRRCRKGHGVLDKELEIYGEHRITKDMIETITYVAQLVPSFERASEAIKKLLKIEVSATQIQIVSEEVGKKVFEAGMVKVKEAYEKPEIAAPQELQRYRKDGRLYILTDGSQVNTRVEDVNGSTWKEMKLGLVFCDKDVIKQGDGSHTIIKKEYVSYLGSVIEFKAVLFATAARAGYGKLKEVVVVGDGAPWIWNMCEELFPDAVQILDFYHLSENTHNYAKALYPEDEVRRKKWVKQVLDLITEGKIEEAIKFIEEKKEEKIPDYVVNLSTYFKNNQGRINYKAYKEKGYYIGSGAIESANKMVIQQRMKQSGMRWSISGGQYIAALRTKHESGLWSEIVGVINAS
jgi:hypothetical protein